MTKKSFKDKLLANLDKFDREQISKYIQILDDEKNHLSSILEGISIALFEISLDGKIIYLNKQAQKLIQMPFEKVKDRDFLSLNIDVSLKLIFSQTLSGNAIRGEDIMLVSDKNSHFVVNSFPKVIDKKIKSFIFSIQDETESSNKKHKSLHDKSIASLALLTAGVAHEIKNPLGALDLHVQLIERFIKNKAIPDKKELFDLTEVLGEEIHRLNEIVNNFLFSVRPIKAIKKPENLNSIIKEVIKIIKPEIDKKKIIINFDESPLESIPLDKNYIKQSLINILQNAMHAIDENKKIYLIQIKTFMHDKSIVLKIKDNGVGIDDKNLKNIFDPFFSTKSKGTGLGLTIVYKIIKEHHGEIFLTSKKGKSTEFNIKFPLKPNRFIPERKK